MPCFILTVRFSHSTDRVCLRNNRHPLLKGKRSPGEVLRSSTLTREVAPGGGRGRVLRVVSRKGKQVTKKGENIAWGSFISAAVWRHSVVLTPADWSTGFRWLAGGVRGWDLTSLGPIPRITGLTLTFLESSSKHIFQVSTNMY